MQKKLYLVFGTANQGKSSLIRCLTGVCRKSYKKVKRKNDVIELYIFVSSAQESSISIERLIELINKTRCEHLLIAIRIDSILQKNGIEYPKGQDYYDALKKTYDIEGVVILGSNPLNIDPNLTTQIIEPRKEPPNYYASIVRKVWGWI